MYLVRVQKYSMKVIKGLILLCFLAITISSCFDPPAFTTAPEITYDKIQFKEVAGAGTNDSLILYINFKDGDGDLGIDQDDLFYSQYSVSSSGEVYPFHPSYYYLTDGNCATGTCDTTKIPTRIIVEEGVPYSVLNSEGKIGKLVTNKTRNQPGYSYLPSYVSGNCTFYSQDQILVPEASADASHNILDTILIGTKKYYKIEDQLLYQKNPNHYNIEIKFFVFEGSSGFVEFDWSKFCKASMVNARFPVLSSQSSALEGTLRYGMGNPSFLALFSVKQLKLEIRIRDRALNTSNKVSTQQFTLDGIRVP